MYILIIILAIIAVVQIVQIWGIKNDLYKLQEFAVLHMKERAALKMMETLINMNDSLGNIIKGTKENKNDTPSKSKVSKKTKNTKRNKK